MMKKKIIVLMIILPLCFLTFVPFLGASAEESVQFKDANMGQLITRYLKTGGTLALPRMQAFSGEQDISDTVTVEVRDSSNNLINAQGQYLIENMQSGTYTVRYLAGSVYHIETYTVTVGDDYPSLSVTNTVTEGTKGKGMRIRNATSGSSSTIYIALYDDDNDKESEVEQEKWGNYTIIAPQGSGSYHIVYSVTENSHTVKMAFYVPVTIDWTYYGKGDYEGNYIKDGHFETNLYLEDYNLAYWCSTMDAQKAMEVGVTDEVSRSGKKSLKVKFVDTIYQPTVFWKIDLTQTPMMKDDESEYLLRLYIKKGEDFAFDTNQSIIPAINFHILAREHAEAEHYGRYKWTLGNLALKFVDAEDWAMVEYRFVSYSDEYVFSRDWLDNAQGVNYDCYRAIHIVIECVNTTGTFYIDDVSLTRVGNEVPDFLSLYPHEENSGGGNGGGGAGGGDNKENKGCKTEAASVLSVVFLGALAIMAANKSKR